MSKQSNNEKSTEEHPDTMNIDIAFAADGSKHSRINHDQYVATIADDEETAAAAAALIPPSDAILNGYSHETNGIDDGTTVGAEGKKLGDLETGAMTGCEQDGGDLWRHTAISAEAKDKSAANSDNNGVSKYDEKLSGQDGNGNNGAILDEEPERGVVARCADAGRDQAIDESQDDGPYNEDERGMADISNLVESTASPPVAGAPPSFGRLRQKSRGGRIQQKTLALRQVQEDSNTTQRTLDEGDLQNSLKVSGFLYSRCTYARNAASRQILLDPSLDDEIGSVDRSLDSFAGSTPSDNDAGPRLALHHAVPSRPAAPVNCGRSQPGAFPIPGRAPGPVPSWFRDQRSSSPRSARSGRSLARTDSPLLPSFLPRLRRSILSNFSQHGDNLGSGRNVIANPVEAEAVLYAKDVTQNSKRQRCFWWTFATCCVLVIIGLAIGLPRRYSDSIARGNGDLRCLRPPEEWDVFTHCRCNRTTSGSQTAAGLKLSDDELTVYEYISEYLYNETLSGRPSYPIGSCDDENQLLLWIANYERYGISLEDTAIVASLERDVYRRIVFETVQQRFILGLLFFKTHGESWARRDGWLAPASVCEWLGVSCNVLGRVMELKLSSNGLSGNLPPQLGKMPYLRKLDLSLNSDIVGTIPTSFFNMSSLHEFDMTGNMLSGTLPAEMANLDALDRLILTNNSFLGTIPTEFGLFGRMRELALNHNNLTGTLPKELGEVTNLQVFQVSANEITGTLPEELGKLKFLEIMDVSENKITGTIPDIFQGFDRLETLFVSDTELTGSVPQSYCDAVRDTDLLIMSCDGTKKISRDCDCCFQAVSCAENLPNSTGSGGLNIL